MKHKPIDYARAFAKAASKKLTKEAQTELVRRFVALVIRNHDTFQFKKILTAAEQILREISGQRKIVIETAREQAGLKSRFEKMLRPDDIVQIKITPELIAGVRITINDELVFENTVRRKLNKIFS